jgi:hypothetical protein
MFLASIADPYSAFHFDTDPDPTFHFDADPVWVRIQHKKDYKGHKIKNVSPTFWDAMLRLTLKRQGYVQFLLSLKNCAKYCLYPEQEPDPEQ